MLGERERATKCTPMGSTDLMKAGINPAYTATGGSGASTGSSSTPNKVRCIWH